mmetsp:Transcript_24194/g.46058  ORF Transcript_24194/g.46058 Transcript_24194/m.46058 type:complete len:512 (-) Transcript_24194:863-2398(-)
MKFQARNSTCLFLVLFWRVQRISSSNHVQDLEWDISRKAGYPTISFSNTTDESEVTFLYEITGFETPEFGTSKYLEAIVYESDCVTYVASEAILHRATMTKQNEYMLELDIVKEKIFDSPYYESIDNVTGALHWCVRVNYMYYDGAVIHGVTYHETNVTVIIDMLSGFRLADIGFERVTADQAITTTRLQAPMEVYFCDDNDVEIDQPTFRQGSVLQICVRIADAASSQQVFVADVLSCSLNQLLEGVYENVVDNTEPSALTTKRCRIGVCNIKTQLSSKFFARGSPGPLIISGTALLALGVEGQRSLKTSALLWPGVSERSLEENGSDKQVESAKEKYEKFTIGVSLDRDTRNQPAATRIVKVSIGVSVFLVVGCCSVLACAGRKFQKLLLASPEVLIPLDAFMSTFTIKQPSVSKIETFKDEFGSLSGEGIDEVVIPQTFAEINACPETDASISMENDQVSDCEGGHTKIVTEHYSLPKTMSDRQKSCYMPSLCGEAHEPQCVGLYRAD